MVNLELFKLFSVDSVNAFSDLLKLIREKPEMLTALIQALDSRDFGIDFLASVPEELFSAANKVSSSLSKDMEDPRFMRAAFKAMQEIVF